MVKLIGKLLLIGLLAAVATVDRVAGQIYSRLEESRRPPTAPLRLHENLSLRQVVDSRAFGRRTSSCPHPRSLPTTL